MREKRLIGLELEALAEDVLSGIRNELRVQEENPKKFSSLCVMQSIRAHSNWFTEKALILLNKRALEQEADLKRIHDLLLEKKESPAEATAEEKEYLRQRAAAFAEIEKRENQRADNC